MLLNVNSSCSGYLLALYGKMLKTKFKSTAPKDMSHSQQGDKCYDMIARWPELGTKDSREFYI